MRCPIHGSIEYIGQCCDPADHDESTGPASTPAQTLSTPPAPVDHDDRCECDVCGPYTDPDDGWYYQHAQNVADAITFLNDMAGRL